MPDLRCTQTETITWKSCGYPGFRPDVDVTVLIFTKDGDLTLGSWDDEHGAWWDTEGEPVDALYWTHVEGPAEL